MNVAALMRLLELVERELGAADARVEIGGREPTDPQLVTAPLDAHARLVAVFSRAPDNMAHTKEKLALLVRAFHEAVSFEDESPAVPSPSSAQREVDDALEAFRVLAGAETALVIDERSPVVWGLTGPLHGPGGVPLGSLDATVMADLGVVLRKLLEGDATLEAVARACGGVATESDQGEGFDEKLLGDVRAWSEHIPDALRASYLRLALAIADLHTVIGPPPARGRTPGQLHLEGDHKVPFAARSFASIYFLVAVFHEHYSELRAEGALVRGGAAIERLVLSLPPRDPPPDTRRRGRLRSV